MDKIRQDLEDDYTYARIQLPIATNVPNSKITVIFFDNPIIK